MISYTQRFLDTSPPGLPAGGEFAEVRRSFDRRREVIAGLGLLAPGLLSTRFNPTRRSIEAVVADTGPGLDREALGHLFEPFFTTKSEGTGLGLAIAREITLAHRGDLVATNRTVGPGAVFTLVLPLDGGKPR